MLTRQKSQLRDRLEAGQADKLDAFAQMLAGLSPDERWLVGEYVEQASLNEFLDKNTASSLLDSPANISNCTLALTRQRRPRRRHRR